MDTPHQKQATGIFRLITAAIGFIFRVGSEAARVTGEVHHTVKDQPKLLTQDHQADISLAPRPYQVLHFFLIRAANYLHEVSNTLNHYYPIEKAINAKQIQAQGILNGVMGDKLHDWDHPSAIAMQFIDIEREPTTLFEQQERAINGIAIFLHGLCLNENEWQNEQTQLFVQALKAKGIEPVWLRYNSGLGISENGERLAHLIEAQWDADSEKTITFIGHSMGGLVARSAIYYAQHHADQAWLRSVTHSVYVASPHEGAKLEKLGHFVNSILGYSPYTKPLMSLGNIRSRGIRSLRYSNIEEHEEDQPFLPSNPFNHEIQHLMIGARLPNPFFQWLLGDGLVTDSSAMAVSHFPIDHEQVTRLFVNDVGHMGILFDERLYRSLAVWFFEQANTIEVSA